MVQGVTVYLVGAGPGDPGLITVRALELIKRADAVVYDYLSNDELLAHIPEGAQTYFVGKKGFSEHVTQDQINGLLVELARDLADQIADREAVIVRLKGGDPFVFGRGGEEALALRDAGIAFEIVPGVTSGIAAPAYAGIPVTHRQVASSVTFVTGHEDPTRQDSSIDWPALAALSIKGNTLCFYMGVRNIGLIAEGLMSNGASGDTPVALVRWGTTPEQETLACTLADAAERVRAANFQAPAIIVVGQVAALRDKLAWFEDAPLFGKRVVVTRSRSQASVLTDKLARLGADVYEFPTIEFADPDSFDVLDQSLYNLAHFDRIVFTSVNGVEGFFRRLKTLPVEGMNTPCDARALAGLRVAAIGPATAARLRNFGIEPDAIPAEYRAEAVFEAIIADAGSGAEAPEGSLPLKGERICVARAQVAREILPQLLEEAGAEVVVAPVYKTVLPSQARAEELAARLEEGAVDAITFTSSSTADNLMKLLGPRAHELLSGVDLFSIGPITAATLEKHGFSDIIQADTYTIDGLIQAMEQTYTSR